MEKGETMLGIQPVARHTKVASCRASSGSMKAVDTCKFLSILDGRYRGTPSTNTMYV